MARYHTQTAKVELAATGSATGATSSIDFTPENKTCLENVALWLEAVQDVSWQVLLNNNPNAPATVATGGFKATKVYTDAGPVPADMVKLTVVLSNGAAVKANCTMSWVALIRNPHG